LLKYD
jgi:hypothetical protein